MKVCLHGNPIQLRHDQRASDHDFSFYSSILCPSDHNGFRPPFPPKDVNHHCNVPTFSKLLCLFLFLSAFQDRAIDLFHWLGADGDAILSNLKSAVVVDKSNVVECKMPGSDELS